ncbi:MAG: tetratricopeptide repeat protein [Candidatus Omnitrophota bacterium]
MHRAWWTERGDEGRTMNECRAAERRIRAWKIICGAIILFAPFLIYANSLHNDFLLGDDEDIVINNVYLREWRHIPRLFTENYRAGSGQESRFWRPFQLVMYSPVVQTAGIQPKPFHLESIFFHGLAGLFLYLLFLKFLYRPGRGTLPVTVIALGALVWLTHPLHNEEIAVTTGLASPAHLFWMLFGIFAFVCYEEKKNRAWYLAALAAFALSLCSKESAIVFPALLLGTHAAGIKAGMFRKTSAKTIAKQHAAFWAIAAIYVTARILSLKAAHIMPAFDNTGVFGGNFSWRVYTSTTAIGHGLKSVFFPIALHPERAWPVFTSFFSAEVFLSSLFVAAVAALAIALWKKDPFFSLGIFWFFVSYFPMSNLALTINGLVRDHWFYTPSAGIILALTALGVTWRNGVLLKTTAVVFACGVVAFGSMTILRNPFWKDTETVSRFILSHGGRSAETWNNLAGSFMAKGENAKAAVLLEKAIELAPGCARLYNNLGILRKGSRENEKAISLFEKAIELNPKFEEAYANLGTAYGEMGRKKEALALLKKAAGINPRSAVIRCNLGNAYGAMGQRREADEAYIRAIEIDPGYVPAYNALGNAARRAGEKEKAIALYTQAMELDPACAATYNNLGSSCRDAGEPEKAAALYKKAIALDASLSGAYCNLGLLYANAGKSEDAIAMFEKAVEINPYYATAYSNLGVAYRSAGREKEALAMQKKASQLDPNSEPIRRNLAAALGDMSFGDTPEHEN